MLRGQVLGLLVIVQRHSMPCLCTMLGCLRSVCLPIPLLGLSVPLACPSPWPAGLGSVTHKQPSPDSPCSAAGVCQMAWGTQ